MAASLAAFGECKGKISKGTNEKEAEGVHGKEGNYTCTSEQKVFKQY